MAKKQTKQKTKTNTGGGVSMMMPPPVEHEGYAVGHVEVQFTLREKEIFAKLHAGAMKKGLKYDNSGREQFVNKAPHLIKWLLHQYAAEAGI